MKVLFVSSGNSKAGISPTVKSQGESLKRKGVDLDYFLIVGKGIKGYLKNYFILKRKIMEFKPNVIHAHYGLSGLLANLQREIPVVATFHGSDVHYTSNKKYSILTKILSSYSIVVANYMIDMLRLNSEGKYSVIPCGVSLKENIKIDKLEARKKMGLKKDGKYILFSSSFNNKIKNAALAIESVNKVGKGVQVLELKNKNREQVTLLLNAVDMALMTSINEGSPQFIKEAMACNCPIVSTDVGDVREIIGNTKGCYICSYDPLDVADKIIKVLDFGKRTDGREKITHLDEKIIAQKIVGIYNRVLNDMIT